MAEKQRFTSTYAFIMAAIGSAVGLGNIWRYPYVAYKNGGGAFIIAYLIAFFTAAIPMLILEYVIGTKYHGSAPKAFARLNRKAEFIGWIPTLICGFIIFYYSVVIAWAVNYTGFAFTKAWGANTEDFFYNKFLGLTDSPLHLGGINWPVFGALVVIWGLAYFFCSKRVDKGVEMLNKIVNPFMFLLMILITLFGIRLIGATEGLNMLFTPHWPALLNPSVWIAAYGHVFFSCSLAMGVMIVYASYLPKKVDLVTTSFIAGLTNAFFEIICAVAVFSILGFMAVSQGVSVDSVAKAGPGLTFVVFPQGMNLMEGYVGRLFGILFFICLVSAGSTSFISLLEAFSAPFVEKFNAPRKKVFAITCSVGFVASILFATNAGLYILDMVDYVANNYGLTLAGILEAVACAWVFKQLPAFQQYANQYSVYKAGKWWYVCVKYILPMAILFNLLIVAYRFILANGYEGYPSLALLIYCGGTAFITITGVMVLSKLKWHEGMVWVKPNEEGEQK